MMSRGLSAVPAGLSARSGTVRAWRQSRGVQMPLTSASHVRPWRETIVFGALWLAFLGLPIRAFGVENELLRNAGRFSIDLGGAALVAVGLWSLRRAVGSPSVQRYASAFTLLAASLLAAGTGLVRGNTFLLWVVMGGLPFLSLLVVLAIPGDEKFTDRLLKLLVWQTVVGVLFATYVILFDPIQSRAAWNGLAGDGMGKMAARSLYATPFLLACLSRLKLWQVVLAVTAWLELTVLGVFGASRGLMTVTFFLMPLSIGLTAFRARTRIRGVVVKLVGTSALLAALLLTATYSGRWPDFGPYVSDRWEQAVERFAETAPEDLTFRTGAAGALDSAKQEFLEGSSRGGEFVDFLSQMKTLDYIFGRGFGGTWESSFWGQEWLMVHIGPGHLLLVGGLPLLLSFAWVLVTAALTAWSKLADNPVLAGAFIYMIVFTQSFLQHGAMQDEIEVYFFWVCVGLSLAAGGSRAIRRPALLQPTRLSRAAG